MYLQVFDDALVKRLQNRRSVGWQKNNFCCFQRQCFWFGVCCAIVYHKQNLAVFQCRLPIKFLQPVLEDVCSHPGMWYILIIISYGILSYRGGCVMIIPLDTLTTTPSEGRCDLYYYLTQHKMTSMSYILLCRIKIWLHLSELDGRVRP